MCHNSLSCARSIIAKERSPSTGNDQFMEKQLESRRFRNESRMLSIHVTALDKTRGALAMCSQQEVLLVALKVSGFGLHGHL
jgi:hypothetical protein